MKLIFIKTMVFVTVAVTMSLPGCVKKEDPPPPPPKDQRNESSLRGMMRQEKQIIQNDFKNLGLYYFQYHAEFGRSPSKWASFKSYIERDGPPSLIKGIEEARYVVIWSANLSSNQVLAYEKQPDVDGYQVVLFGDVHIETIKSEELQKALEAKN